MNRLQEGRVVLLQLDFPRLPDARCHSNEIPPDDFYIGDDKKEARKRARVKEFCNPCPVRLECLQWALDHQEKWGIWGGMDPLERRKLMKQRRNG